MRGKDENRKHPGTGSRITPAYAGKRPPHCAENPYRRDHPRVCGEKSQVFDFDDCHWGSPPRMRGKAARSAPRKGLGRITPAYAGKSCRAVQSHWRARDHPRVCGEKAAILRAVWVPRGSPPRMRGKAASKVSGPGSRRITPAYAGKRGSRSRAGHPEQDHPRVCGEKASVVNELFCHQGSPPRMRGKATSNSKHKSTTGITPAYAGKRLPRQCHIIVSWDHPRVCGEKTILGLSKGGEKGSPPRMRGKVRSVCVFSTVSGITPAYAGKSFRFLPAVFGSRDQPPRMRGKAVLTGILCLCFRITPAYAGKSRMYRIL